MDKSKNSDHNIERYKTKPYNHQLEYLRKHGRQQANALLAEMGTGKTWMIINNVADLWSSGECDGVLVFAPNGVHTNWTRLELPKHMPDWVRWRSAAWAASMNKKEKAKLERLYEDAGNGELRIFTMNWEAMQTKRGFEAAMRFASCFNRLMIVADESDAAKNPAALRTKNLMKLKNYSYWRRIMTGTPIDGSPFSAFAQFSFLDENILETTSYYAFKSEYAELHDAQSHLVRNIVGKKVKMKPEERRVITEHMDLLKKKMDENGRADLIIALADAREAFESENSQLTVQRLEDLKNKFSPRSSPAKAKAERLIMQTQSRLNAHVRRVNAAFNPNRLPQIVAKDKNGKKKYKNLDKLSRLIAPYSFRVLKSECLDLPKKIYKNAFFDLTKEQREVYDKMKDECRMVFENNETPVHKLVAISKLAQITSGYYIHPMSEEPVRIPGPNPKIELLVQRVQAILDQGRKVIVWARYRIEIEDIVTALKAADIDAVQYHGGVKKNDRTEAIDEFENGEVSVFVGNQQAGGTGITLVAASYVIYFSNDFSLRNRLQSEDRAHRIGQEQDVTYINLAAQGTIDEAVIGALTNKQDVADAIVDKGLALFQ